MAAGSSELPEVSPLPHPTVSEVMFAVCRHYRLPRIEMVSMRRAREVARPRQVAMYLSKRLTPLSLPNIGKIFGDRDHTTVIHACRQIEKLMLSDPNTRAAVEAIQKQFEKGRSD